VGYYHTPHRTQERRRTYEYKAAKGTESLPSQNKKNHNEYGEHEDNNKQGKPLKRPGIVSVKHTSEPQERFLTPEPQ
jgi:hypothetical protein